MINRLILAALYFIITGCFGVAWAQTPGVDYLLGRNYQKAMLETHPATWAGGIFLRTGGDARATVKAMCQSRKFSDLVVHLAPFDNSHAYPINKLLPQIIADAKWLQSIQTLCPDTRLMPSPFCEHNHPANKIKPVLDAIKKAAPSTYPVNTIWRGGVVDGYTTEMHLADSKPRAPPRGEYTVSFDGFGGDGSGDFTDADIDTILKRYSSARHIRLWNFRYNGKFGHKDRTPLSARKHWPDANYLRGHVAIMRPRVGALAWPDSALYKPFADDHGIGGKDNKAMVIIPSGKSSLRVFDSSGKQIDTMAIPPPPLDPNHNGEPKGRRFYSKKYAYQLAELARRNTGSQLIRIEDMPLTDGAKRSGRFK